MSSDSINDITSTSTVMEELVQVEKIKLLYQQSIAAAIISLIIASLLARILWLHNGSNSVVTWYLVLLAASLLRVVLFFFYYRARPVGVSVLDWAPPYFITLFISSTIWGIGCIMIMPKDSLLYQAICFYFLMGMCAGAMSVYSTNQLYALSTVYMILGPITLWALFQDNHVAFFMGLGSSLFLVSAVRVTKVIANSQSDNFLRKYQLTEAQEKVANLAKLDPLTGIFNRHTFDQEALKLLGGDRGSHEPFSLLILNIDHFKKINDTYGHEMGDSFLKLVANSIQETILDTDLCARLEGDEFTILLPNAKSDMGIIVAERLNSLIVSLRQKDPNDESVAITVSIGVTESTQSVRAAIDEAKQAMQQAKENGRNQFVVYSENK